METSHIIWDQNPILFDFHFYQLHYYTLLFITGMISGLFIIQHEYSRQNNNVKLFDKLFIYSIIGIVVGARLGHCLLYDFAYYSHHPLEIFLPVRFQPEFEIVGFRGLASHGGAIGLLLAIYLFSRNYKISFLQLLDIFALATPATGMFIRIGNFFNSEIIGKSSDLFWAVIFKRVDNTPRHPAQLYEAMAYLLIFVILIVLRKRKTNLRAGILFSLFLILLFSSRFMFEFIKENQSAFESNLIINMGQILSIPFILIGIILLVWLSRKKNT